MHTPGPWYWEKRASGMIRLYTPKNGSCTVMDFGRMGMQSAQPRFSDRGDKPLGGVMIDARELDLDKHPDAVLIAAAPNLLEVIKMTLVELEAQGYGNNTATEINTMARLRLAIEIAGG